MSHRGSGYQSDFSCMNDGIASCKSTIPKNLVHPPRLIDTGCLETVRIPSTRRSLTSDDSDSDFQLVKKKSQKKSRKSKNVYIEIKITSQTPLSILLLKVFVLN